MSSNGIESWLRREALEDDRVKLASYVTHEEPHDLLAVVATLCPAGGVAARLLVVNHSDVCNHPQRCIRGGVTSTAETAMTVALRQIRSLLMG
jgi:hypothetical protein